MTWSDAFVNTMLQLLRPLTPLLTSPLLLILPSLWFLFRRANSAKALSADKLKVQVSVWLLLAVAYYNLIGLLNASVYISTFLVIVAISIDKLVYFLRANTYTNLNQVLEPTASLPAYYSELNILEQELPNCNLNKVSSSRIRAALDACHAYLEHYPDADLSWVRHKLSEARALLNLPSAEEVALLRAFFFFAAVLTFVVFQFVVAGYAFDPLFVPTVLSVEFFGVPAVLIVWSAVGSIASLLHEYVNKNGYVLGDARSLFFEPILSVVLSSVSYFAITAIFPGLLTEFGGEGVVAGLGVDTLGQQQSQFAFLSVFGFLTGFYEEISYTFLLEAKNRLDLTQRQKTSEAAQPPEADDAREQVVTNVSGNVPGVEAVVNDQTTSELDVALETEPSPPLSSNEASTQRTHP